MKAIVIRQPWAEQIISGEKKIEYRTWDTSYRGWLLIVSNKQAVGMMEIVDVRYNEAEGIYEWIIGEVKRIEEPFYVRGKPGIFEVEI